MGLAAACCILVVAMAGCKDSDDPPPPTDVVRPVKTLVVTAPGTTAGVELPGQVRASRQADLAFQEVDGRLVELPIAGRKGKEVMKGELLAQIDPTGFESALQSAEGSLGEAYSAMDLARAEQERMAKMKKVTPELVSDSMLERTRGRLKQAATRLKTLETEVEEAEELLENSSLRAPFTGVITRVLVKNQQDVEAGKPIVSLQSSTHLEVLVEAPETMMAAAQSLGLNSISASVRFPSTPGTEFPLVLKDAAPNADPATKTHQIVLEMPKPEGHELPPGMTGTVTLSGKEPGIGKTRILIPAIAVLTDPGGVNYVWLVNPAELRVQRREVQIGRLASSDQIQILAGLEGGERIVVAGVMHLAEGRQVRLWEEQDAGKAR